jgi:sugar phosphate permease
MGAPRGHAAHVSAVAGRAPLRLSLPRLFYGWYIVAAGFGIEALIGALMFHAYGAYVVLLREEFGWSKTLLSAAFAMARAESGIFGPIQGWMTDRFGPRILIRTGMTILGVALMLFSFIRSPVTFFITFFLMAVGSSLGGYLPIGVALVSWFRRRRALALSISSSGMAVGGFLVQFVALAMTHWGWRWTAFASGVAVLLIGVPLAQVVRHRPEMFGEQPDGGDVPDTRPARRRPTTVDFTPREAVRTRAFWLLALGHGAALLVVSAVMVHLIVHVTERLGYSLQQGAAVLALMTAVQLAAQLGGGWVGDHFSKRAICVLCMLAHAGALLIVAHATAFWMIAAFAALHGAAWGIRGPLMSAIRADYFGTASFGTIAGFSSMVVMLGMMAGPLVAGMIADRTGSYVPGFQVLSALAALGSIAFAFATPPASPGRRRRSGV